MPRAIAGFLGQLSCFSLIEKRRALIVAVVLAILQIWRPGTCANSEVLRVIFPAREGRHVLKWCNPRNRLRRNFAMNVYLPRTNLLILTPSSRLDPPSHAAYNYSIWILLLTTSVTLLTYDSDVRTPWLNMNRDLILVQGRLRVSAVIGVTPLNLQIARVRGGTPPFRRREEYI
ncbi:hypothetical protein BU17DRAFT_69120 [Hysterangium stoloniferum]|nr:hypothetical protein BU17DRAFT_69120 [Hysterangium stoloniferum]